MTSAAVAAFNVSRRFVLTTRCVLRLNSGSSVRPYVIVSSAAAHRCRRPQLVGKHTPPPRTVLACSLSSSKSNTRTNTTSSLQQLEASLVSQLPSSFAPSSAASLSSPSSLPVVRHLMDVYLAQHKYAEAERLLWRLCDEQTRGGAAPTVGSVGEKKDEETVDAIRTLASIVNVRRSAASSSMTGSGSGSSGAHSDAIAVLDDLTDRYNTLTASSSSAVVDHPTNVNFIAALSRAYVDEGERDKAERRLRSALLSDEQSDESTSGEAELEAGRRLRYATAYNFLGIAAYTPPVHVHSESCAHGHGHAHEDAELRQYDWSESEVRWKRALSYLTPFIARLSSSHNPASVSSLFTFDSASLHLLRTYAMTEDNISQAQFTSGREEEAVATLRRSIDALSGLLPSHHSEVLRVRHQLIRLHLAANSVSQAQKECEPLLTVDHRLLSVELTSSLDDLADSFFRLRHYQYAARLFQQCIAVREAAAVVSSKADEGGEAGRGASGGVGDLITASRYNDLAMCELKLNNHKAAEKQLRRSIAIKDHILGADHWESAVSVHNLGAALMGQQRYSDAERELQRARRLYESKYEAEQQHSAVRERDAVQAIVSSHLGQCYALMERWNESVVEYERAVSIKQRTVGDHPSVAMDLTQLGGVLLQAGEYEEAVRTFERVRALAERMYGGEHTNVAVALHWLSMAENRAGRPEDAVKHARQAVAQGEKLHGAGSIQLSTLDVMKKNLTELLHAPGANEDSSSTTTANHPRSR